MGGEEKRHQMMQNLFGDQSEEEDEEEEEEEEEEEADVDSEHESNPHPPPHYLSDEAGGPGPEGEGEIDVEGHGEVDVESEGDVRDRDVEPELDPIESEGERDQSSEEVIAGERKGRERKETDSDEKEEYGQRMATSRRRDVIESGSERSEDHHYLDDEDEEDEEVDQGKSPSKSPKEEDENQLPSSAPEMRDVFGDSDEDEEEGGYVVQNDADRDLSRFPLEDDGIYEKGSRPDDMIQDEEALFDPEEDQIDAKPKEKPVGPPLVLEVPLRPAPARPQKMNMIKVSNIMGIDPKPFDPKTYVEEDTFVTDESGTKKRIRLENNIVRWRSFRNRDGTTSYESNARFVRWSDGSLQLLIGNEVLDISVQDAQHEQAHLFLRHGKGILQSQGRILKKMRFMPSSLSSNSHRLLTALVDSRHKKVYKVKNCITDIDPEREKEEKEKAASQSIRANLLLNRKREKVNKKYTPAVDRRRQLSPGFLEDALDEEEEADYYDSRRSRHRLEEDLEMEARAERRIMNAKKGPKEVPLKFSTPATNKTSRRPVEFSGSEQEESEYESYGEEEERSPVRRRADEPEEDYEEEEEEEEAEEDNDGDAEVDEASEEEEPEEPKTRGRDPVSGSYKRKGIESDEDSPPRKAPATHRRMAVVYDSDED